MLLLCDVFSSLSSVLTVNGVLTKDEQIILGVLLSVFLVVLIIIICVSVK